MRTLLFLALSLLLVFPAAAADEETELRESVNDLVELYSDGLAVAYPEFRHVARVPLFGGSVPDAVVLFSMEGFHGGNVHAEYLAVFAAVEQEEWSGHQLHRFRLIGVQKIGGRGWRTFDDASLRVKGQVLTLSGKLWSETDAGCCPSKPITKSFVVTANGVAEQ